MIRHHRLPDSSERPTRATRHAPAASAATSRQTVKSSADFALQCFHIDRAEVSARLYKLSHSLAAGAVEMEMVAAERVFDKRFSAQLVRKARDLKRLAKQLNRMHEDAARARFPGD